MSQTTMNGAMNGAINGVDVERMGATVQAVQQDAAALAACLTTSLVYHAAARGILIESMESTVEGDLDLRGFLGLSDQIRRGYKEIRVNFSVKSDASPEQLRELTTFSPVYDIVSNPVPVRITIETR